ncbi:hypothetical protein DL768_001616 [Monosporascus sp. mg162]|nr:hypothetical protein DL768_001616 [Monosporascus sp. mg162]
MLNYAKQLWAADWVEHKRPATPVDDWGLLLGNTYSSSRIGEYIESSCRAGTGRGLYFKDLTFVVFINEIGTPEFAIQLTRDAKNFTCTPDKRPQHALYEGIEPGLLCFNPMLPFLARLLAYGAFRDYNTIDDLLTIVPPEGEMLVIQWKDHLLETPFFRNQFESEATRMVYAGHTDPNTLPMHYLPRNGADGQAAYHGRERRALVLDLFRGLTIPRNPRLWQCLPAKKQYECESCPEMMRINQELLKWQGKTDNKSLIERKKLYAEKRQLVTRKLRNWQKNQPIKHDDPPGYHRAIFDRVRFLMPERDRLAQNLFEIDKLRSPAGLAVLRDMLALYQKRRNVEYRPGLEPDKCRCGKSNDGSSYDWRHVYECHKAATAKVDGFAELCFLCNEWFCGIGAWEEHCQHHLDHPDSLPIWCDPLIYGGVLARAGHCPFCLGDGRLQPSVRMHQFKIRWTWLDHIQTHITALQNGALPVRCPRLHSHCPGEFTSVLELQFHLQDAFGIEHNGNSTKMKRPRSESDDIPSPKRKRPQQWHDNFEGDRMAIEETQYTVTNITVGSLERERQLSSVSPDLPQGCSTSSWGLTTTDLDDEAPSGYSTPLSSIGSEEVIDPAMFLAERRPDDKPKDCIAANDLSEATPVVLLGTQGAYPDSVSVAANLSGNGDKISITYPMGIDEHLDVTPADLVVRGTDAEASPDHAVADKNLICGVPSPDNHEKALCDRPLPLDQEGTVFEVENLVAKGRIGRRIWYKVKWKGYPESDNSWVKKMDIGKGAIANYEATHPQNLGEFKFERLVSKREMDGITLYEAKWQGQADTENIWVGKQDLGAKIIAAFEANS